METYSVIQRTKIIELYFENHRSVILTQRAYRQHFNVRNPPSKSMIQRLVQRFQQHGAVCDLPRSGRPYCVRNNVNIERVQQSIQENPETSTRRRSAELGLSRRSLRRILREDLMMFPYKVQLVQELKPTDYEQRLVYAVRLQEVTSDNNFIHRLIMSDEAHFHLNGFVNRQNCRVWGTENPRAVHQRQLHPIKCTVWCAVTSQQIIGPYFFEDNNGNAVSVTGERYRHMLENFLRPAIDDNEEMWFQQNGATAHTVRSTMDTLRGIFDERIISRNSAFNWPPRSPDLTAPDFFLWGYLKEKVYANKSRSLDQLKENIRTEIRNVMPETLTNVMENVLKRAQLCEAKNGQHLCDIIFHT
ncbi:hypothetical protein ANTRET_LOCUS4642 [Anthophora retusa]